MSYLNYVWSVNLGVAGIHYGAVGVDGAVDCCYAMLGVDVAEEMGLGFDNWQTFQQFFGAVVDIVIEIEDAVGRRMCNQYVRVDRNLGYVLCLTVGDAVSHEHRDAVEFHAVYLDS